LSGLPISPADLILAVLLMTALYTDLTSERIPNALTFGVMALGIVVSAVSVSWWWGLAGIAVAFLMMFPGFAFFGAVKAGDGKLLMAVGSLLGWHDVVEACLLTYILNLPYGLAVLIYKGRLGNFFTVLKTRFNKIRGQDLPEPDATYVVFAPVIVVATLIARFLEVFQW